MSPDPKTITLSQLPEIIASHFQHKPEITCYIGSNAATPTASLEAITAAVKARSPKLPFLKMVHLLLQGPVPYVEMGLQDRILVFSIFSGAGVREAANDGRAFYLPCTLANLDSLIGKGRRFEPDVAILKVSRNPFTGEFSLGLSVEALHTAIDHARVVVAELDPSMPFTEGQSVVDSRSIDYIIEEGIKPVYELHPPDFEQLSAQERRIGELITSRFIEDGATIQVGIGKIPDAVIGTIKQAAYRDLGVQTELYGDGLMILQKAGIVTNRRKKANLGYSTTSLIMGSRELYDFVHMRTGVQMRPSSYTNSAETVRRNAPFISINTAVGVDLFGNVWADYIELRRYYGGVGGQPDFVRALNDRGYGPPIIAIQSVTDKGQSKISKHSPPGINLTACSYDGIVIVTEWGIADLRELTVGEKAVAIASISHPSVREELLGYIIDDPMFTKPVGFTLGKTARGVTMYGGKIALDES
jgi:4-hydroxybutyrate CoA-transferase